jgi:sialic acid synthase SpsE|tara:strand:+ start:1813 stop:1956 length:144 start_codon:yes stop_codon:yes gene_type:complete
MPCHTQGALKIVRPSFGAALKYFDAFLGRIVNQEIKEFTAVKWEQIQ